MLLVVNPATYYYDVYVTIEGCPLDDDKHVSMEELEEMIN